MNTDLVTWREKVGFYLDDSNTSTGKFIDVILVVFNLLACALYVIASYSSESDEMPSWFLVAEGVVASEFILEYLIRVWTAKSRLRYIFSFYGIIDLITILPTIATALRSLRVLKVLRILRFIRFLETQSFFFGKLSGFQLQACRTVFTIFTILFLASGFILETEQVEGQIKTFGEAFYFSVTTLSTVGFGDYAPQTAQGRLVTVVMILGGSILIPWQAGKLVRMLIAGESRKKKITCPKCGLIGHDFDASHCKACGSIIFQEYQNET